MSDVAPPTDLAEAYCRRKRIYGMAKQHLETMNSFLVMFEAVDENKDGHLDVEEVKMLCRDYQVFGDKGVEYTMKRLDADGSGTIDKDEFMRLFVLTWAKYDYAEKFGHGVFQMQANDIVDKMITDGYDGQEVLTFIRRNLLDRGGTVDLDNFLNNFFDPTKRR